MAYILEDKEEFTRLENQELIPCYNIKNDISLLDIKEKNHILDAGCGAGTISRFMAKNFPHITIEGCDGSLERASQAKEENKRQQINNINVFNSSLESIDKPENTFDRIICRFVYEYLKTPVEVTKEFHRLCKPGGKVLLIDLDGVFFNLYTQNQFVNNCLATLQNTFQRENSLDLFVGRKLPFYLQEAGFKNIQYQLRSMEFKGQDILREIENYKERFKFAHASFAKILGEEEATLFERLYLDEMGKSGNIIFYNIFSVVGEK